ncbi:hypothetical protein MTO96_041031 [Rhipicephalus appendiculatus]
MGGGIYAHGSKSIYKSSFMRRGSKCKEVMCKAFACGSPTAATWILSRALFLSLLVEARKPLQDRVKFRPLILEKMCSWRRRAPAQFKGGDDTNYDSDESYEDEDAFEISARSAEATRKTEVEACDMSSTSGNESVVQPTNYPVPTETTTLGGIIAENGSVADGTPCLSFIKSNGEDGDSIAVGACYNRKCNGSNPTIYKLPRTVPNPYIYHCQVNTTSINTKLQVAVGCIASCYDSRSHTWNETKLDDGRLCALPKENNNKQICQQNRSMSQRDLRNSRLYAVDSSEWMRRCNYEEERKGNTTQELPDGTPCLLNHERKVHVPTVSDLIVEGICKNGHCIITPPAIPVVMVNIPEEGCEKFVSSISYTEKGRYDMLLLVPWEEDETCETWNGVRTRDDRQVVVESHRSRPMP